MNLRHVREFEILQWTLESAQYELELIPDVTFGVSAYVLGESNFLIKRISFLVNNGAFCTKTLWFLYYQVV